jgi:serine/threonine protein kinase
MILSNEDHKFKLIDLGACADLRTGTNYVPNEGILDPGYAPPEQFVLPTNSPELSGGLFSSLAMSPMLWAKHKPDRFDIWSAGICMLQLALPSLRSDRGLQTLFRNLYGPRFNYNLDAWREKSSIPDREFEILDADGEAGWSLLKEMLRERAVERLDGGGVRFVDNESTQRLSASEALKFSFLKQAREPSQRSKSSTKGSKAEAFGQSVNVWKDLSRKMFDLEAKLNTQVSATESQTVKVKKLQQKAISLERSIVEAEARKKVNAQLDREQKRLDMMEKRLAGLEGEMKVTAKKATGLLGFLKGMSSPSAKREEAPPPPPPPPKEVPPPSAWEELTATISNLDFKLGNQISAAEKQSVTVKRLQQKVEQGVVDEDELQKAEKALAIIQNRINELKEEKERVSPPPSLAVKEPAPPPAVVKSSEAVKSKGSIDSSLKRFGGFAARFVPANGSGCRPSATWG